MSSSPKSESKPGSPLIKSPIKLLSPKRGSKSSLHSGPQDDDDDDYFTRPEFIYGGPFIGVKKASPFLDTATPMNVPLQGTFKRSFAYFSLKDRTPVILTKIIDQLSRDGQRIRGSTSASDDDIRNYMQHITKLKNDLVTNKDYEKLKVDTPNAKKWNDWIDQQPDKKYFNNTWLFTECYVYRRLKEGCELHKGLANFDYFEDQKNKSFTDNELLMCMVADRVVNMLPKAEKDRRKQDFMTLLKLCLWSNKCDLSLTLGDQMDMVAEAERIQSEVKPAPPPPPSKKKGKKKKEDVPAGPRSYNFDPFQMIVDYKDKVLVDDSAKISDQIVTKSEAMNKAINNMQAATTFKFKCSCHRLATAAGLPVCKQEAPPPPEPPKEGEEPKKEEPKKEEPPKQIPCPAKMNVPPAVMFDIVCDNTGYELFCDLCLAHFLIAQKIVQKVRFHVKNMPWFVSDVTPKDFNYLIEKCCISSFTKDLPPLENAPKPEGDAAPEGRRVTAENMRKLGEQWKQFVQDGVFVLMDEEFWTTPHCYKDMKKYDYNMYRTLQFAVATLFKGDLNYRKLMGERMCNPSMTFVEALQGFIPCPLIAIRTVKSDTICGLPKGKWDQLNSLNEKWMQTGEYGVIQYLPKGEPLKAADKPCIDYCQTCFGVICPEH